MRVVALSWIEVEVLNGNIEPPNALERLNLLSRSYAIRCLYGRMDCGFVVCAAGPPNRDAAVVV